MIDQLILLLIAPIAAYAQIYGKLLAVSFSTHKRTNLQLANTEVFASTYNSFLKSHGDFFNFHRPGLLGAPGTVSFESKKLPGYFLRQKNDHIRLDSRLSKYIKKDATFMEKVSPHGRSYRLYLHPERLLCHALHPGFNLRLNKDQASPVSENCLFNVALDNKSHENVNIVSRHNIRPKHKPTNSISDVVAEARKKIVYPPAAHTPPLESSIIPQGDGGDKKQIISSQSVSKHRLISDIPNIAGAYRKQTIYSKSAPGIQPHSLSSILSHIAGEDGKQLISSHSAPIQPLANKISEITGGARKQNIYPQPALIQPLISRIPHISSAARKQSIYSQSAPIHPLINRIPHIAGAARKQNINSQLDPIEPLINKMAQMYSAARKQRIYSQLSKNGGIQRIAVGDRKQSIYPQPAPIHDQLSEDTPLMGKLKFAAAIRKQAVHPVLDNLDSPNIPLIRSKPKNAVGARKHFIHSQSTSTHDQISKDTSFTGKLTFAAAVRKQLIHPVLDNLDSPDSISSASPDISYVKPYIPASVHDSDAEFEASPGSLKPTMHDNVLHSNGKHEFSDIPDGNSEAASVLVHSNPDITLSQALSSFTPAHPIEITSEPLTKSYHPHHLALSEHTTYVEKPKHPATDDSDEDVDSLSEVHVVHHDHHLVRTGSDKQREQFIDNLMDLDQDLCISIMFNNALGDKYRLASSLNPHGYRPKGDKFSLRTIFKKPKQRRKLSFKAYDEENEDKTVFLNGHKELNVLPSRCTNKPISVIVDSFRSPNLVVSGVKKDVTGTRKDTPAAAPCLSVYGGESKKGECCHFPFLFGKQMYSHCIPARDNQSWCSLTQNLNQDKRWGLCSIPKIPDTENSSLW